MMDHVDLPKGAIPDKYKDEVIHDRYKLRDPPSGEVIGSFNKWQLGLLWKIPNIDETDMLKSVVTEYYNEEKVLFEKNFEKDEAVRAPVKIDLYKTWKSSDLHLRAVYQVTDDDIEDDTNGVLNFLRSKHQVLGAAVINQEGKFLVEEKLARSYMFAGKRYWELPSLITPKDFNKAGLLTSDGSLLLRITFGCRKELPSEHFNLGTVTVQTATVVTGSAPTSSKSNANNANITETDKKCEKSEECSKLLPIDISTIGLDSLPFHAYNFSKTKKFTDGILHVIDKETKQEVDFPVHRVIFAARSPYFESEFEASPRLTIDKYNGLAMETLVEFMYSGEVTNKSDFNLLTELITISEELAVNGLKYKALNNIVETTIDIPQAMTTFKLGMKYNSVVLRVFATEFLNKFKGKIGEHTDELVKFMDESGTQILFDWLLKK